MARTIEDMRKSLHEANGWVIGNLKTKYNSLVPNDLMKLMPTSTIERLLTEIVGDNVTIREGLKIDSKKTYIAEVGKRRMLQHSMGDRTNAQ